MKNNIEAKQKKTQQKNSNERSEQKWKDLKIEHIIYSTYNSLKKHRHTE